MSAMLKLSGVFKRFGALLAIDNLSMHLDEGEVLGVIGPNGSGKTTMFPKPTKGGFSFRMPTLLICKLSNDAAVVSRVHSKSLVLSLECRFSRISWWEQLLQTEDCLLIPLGSPKESRFRQDMRS
jgi:ABC-type histidine transport system ATPase subunit